MMTQDEMRRSGSDETAYRAGSGSYYSETFEKPTGSAGPESSFGRNERIPSGRKYAEGGMSDQDTRRMMTQDEMRRSGSDQTNYPAGTGSYYSETFVKPSGSATQERTSGWNERMERGRQSEIAAAERNLTQDEMRRMGSDQVNYPAGGGSYYTETFERPTGSAGPESSFGRTERVPSGRQYAESETTMGRMGAYPSAEPSTTSKVGQTAAVATGTMKEMGGTVVTKTKGVTSQIGTKAKEFTESNRAEDIAHRAGESLGRAIRKTVAVAKEMASGFNRGVNPKKESREMAPEGAEGDITLRTEQETVKREAASQQTPRGQEKKRQ